MPHALAAPTWARAAGYSLEQVDAFLGRLGHPAGIACYKPYHSTGEDFLHNYLGMIGIPIDLRPEFPTNASLVLLTECAKSDPDLVAKIKGQLRAGKSVVITSGLLRALQDQGLGEIAEIRCTDRRFLAHQYAGGFGAGNFSALDAGTNTSALFPEIDFLTNDSWSLVRAEASGNSFPLLLLNRYSRGVLYVWTMPDNFNDLYALPPEVTTAIKNFVMRGFPARLDGPAQVSLFPYDNGAFIIENFSGAPADTKLSTLGTRAKLTNLVTGETLEGKLPPPRNWTWQTETSEDRVAFSVHLPPHSYVVLAPEGNHGTASAAN